MLIAPSFKFLGVYFPKETLVKETLALLVRGFLTYLTGQCIFDWSRHVLTDRLQEINSLACISSLNDKGIISSRATSSLMSDQHVGHTETVTSV